MNRKLAVILFTCVAVEAAAQSPKAYWSFDKLENRQTQEAISGKADTLEGYFEKAPGFKGY
jgi:hypothetical protein